MKSFVIFTSLFLVSSPALAEPAYTPKIIPKCAVVDLKAGGKGCSYTLEQVKALYQVDSELAMRRTTEPLKDKKLALQEGIIAKTREQLKLAESSLGTAKKRNEELTKQLIDKDKQLQYEIAKPRWGSYIAWGTAALVSSVFVGYVIATKVGK